MPDGHAPTVRAKIAPILDDPSSPGACYDAAIGLRDAGQGRAALTPFRWALRLAPHNPDIRLAIANTYEGLARYGHALAILSDLVRRHPAGDMARYRLGTLLFRLGRGDVAAWEAMERRPNNMRFQASTAYPPDYRPWRGEPMPDRALVVYAEGGFGDTINFASFLPRAAALCREVAFVTRQPIAGLIARSFADVPNLTVNPARIASPVGGRILAMSLPHALRGGGPLPAVPSPYLRPAPVLAEALRRRLRETPGRNVGVFWRTLDPRKSMPVEALAGLAAPGTTLWSLLPNPTAEERRHLDRLAVRTVEELAADAGAFERTAALVAGLDAVVTIDSAVAHLAGALGVPTALLLRLHGDWRWRGGARTDWYESVRLFRQTQAGAWTAVVDAAAGFLDGTSSCPLLSEPAV